VNYKKLVKDLAQRTGLHSEIIIRVLFYLPDSLLQMREGDKVRTPLGTFKKHRTKERPITMPDRQSTAVVPAKVTVRLKPGTRLRVVDDVTGD